MPKGARVEKRCQKEVGGKTTPAKGDARGAFSMGESTKALH